MFFFHEGIRKRDLLFVLLNIALIALLLLLPTGFEELVAKNTMRARGVVEETDDSEVQQLGIVKVGIQEARVRILSGPFKDREITGQNNLIGSMELDKIYAPGNQVLLGIDLAPGREEIVHVNIIDHYRIHKEILLFGVFTLLLLLYAGWTGLKALISFLFTAVMIWKVLLPGFLRGWNPVLLSLGVVITLTALIIFLIGGLQKKGMVAFLGAASGVLFTCILSLGFSKGFHLHGAVKPFSQTLLYSGFPHLDLKKIFLSGIFLASSGAVMDIAMDISASMHEVAQKHHHIHRRDLIQSGFTVGRAVIGTMTTTLLLAYTGGFTTMIMVFIAQGTPLLNIFNIQYVSSEILHTLVGSFGLVTVAPFTALIGGLIYIGESGKRTQEP